MRAVSTIATLALLALAASGCGQQAAGAGASPSASPTPEPLVLEAAHDGCVAGEGGKTLSLGDEGRTLVVDTGSEYGSLEGLYCVLETLGTSQAIVAQLESTTAMMGVQDGTDDTLRYQWSYHPDNGVNMVVTDESPEAAEQ